MRKIHCEEISKNQDFSFEELREMIGWIEPNDDKWTVTLIDGFFDCESQENAQIMASIEEVKALLLKK